MGLRKELVSPRCTFHKGWYVWKGSRIVIPTGHTQIRPASKWQEPEVKTTYHPADEKQKIIVSLGKYLKASMGST